MQLTTLLKEAFERMIHNTTLGAADLERPAGGDRRPLAGIFRVRVVPGKSSSCVQHGCLLGLFGNSWGCLWDADDSSWGSCGELLTRDPLIFCRVLRRAACFVRGFLT